jgi:hypothetical protein
MRSILARDVGSKPNDKDNNGWLLRAVPMKID